MELKMAIHEVNGRRIVEVFDNTGTFVAAIYPNEANNGIKIISKHIKTFDFDDGKNSHEAKLFPNVGPIPAVTIDFLRDVER